MKTLFAKFNRVPLVIFLLAWALQPVAQPDSMPVRDVAGTIRGFLELRSEDGRIVASGDTFRNAHGDRITSRSTFHFKDGSIDDETTIFSQGRNFRLISDHHIQKGRFFPHPMDVLIDTRTGNVTVRTTGKDGKDEVKTDHLDLPADLANGMLPIVLENMPPHAPETTLSMVVATPKARLAKIVISNAGEDDAYVGGFPRKAIRYNIKIELAGIAGAVAPLIGKAPPDIQIWTIGGAATTFAREQGPLYPEGPIMTIQLASPSWPDTSKASH